MLIGHCVDQQGAPPYLPTIEHIEEAARQVSPEGLRQALGENAAELAKLMPELRLRYPDIPEPVALPPELERRYLLRAVSEFVERNARAMPLMLVFEDLHWADESSLLLLQHLAQRVAQIPVLAVGTYRNADLKPGRPLATVLPNLLRQRLAEEMALGRLSADGVADLIRGRAGSPPPPELVALVYTETEEGLDWRFRNLGTAYVLAVNNWRTNVLLFRGLGRDGLVPRLGGPPIVVRRLPSMPFLEPHQGGPSAPRGYQRHHGRRGHRPGEHHGPLRGGPDGTAFRTMHKTRGSPGTDQLAPGCVGM